ncbi:chromate transporter [Planococcus sp. NCCP-2050]|uniref:chromate transporter n=1 Tax=Planococcus sp. NCCP-2050 TaxID=2944679 RepID=UPI002041C745|nr:chromate transporter [Planococcus sp. NCCP-2050]GKW45594.1 putative transporter YwrA [Planococcus sp. NCCP-2050]
MIYWSIFLAFFIPGILGYGGGPSSIPLVEKEVVDNYGWMTTQEFGEMVALANALPGPIATKMAGYIGYVEGGVLGSLVALFASIAPSLLLMIVLMVTLMKYKDSPKVKNITKLIRPVIAVLLGAMTLQFVNTSIGTTGGVQTVILIVVSYWMLEIRKIHPAFVILLALAYGALSSFI